MPIVSTSIKLPEELKARVKRLAKLSHRSPHSVMVSVMVEALEREVSREERLYEFVQEAMQAERDIEEGGNIYRADDVHGWLKQLAQGAASERPQPWRK